MLREIRRLQNENLVLLEQNANLDAEYSRSDRIIHSLKDDRQGIEIINRLKRGESSQSIASWLGRPMRKDGQAMSPTTEKDVDDAMFGYRDYMQERKDPRYWTSVALKPGTVEHLLQLYLTWIHPMHMLFDENHFLGSLRDCADTYCSPSLVNAMCAMACHLWHPRNLGINEASAKINALRTQFLNEAKTMLKDVDHSKMTNIQSHAVIALTEIAMGSGLMAGTRLRLAAEAMLAKQGQEQAKEAERVSQWGVVTLLTSVCPLLSFPFLS